MDVEAETPEVCALDEDDEIVEIAVLVFFFLCFLVLVMMPARPVADNLDGETRAEAAHANKQDRGGQADELELECL